MVRMWLILWIILVCDLAPVLLADCPATYISKRGTTYDVKCLDWSRTHRLQQAFITRQSPCFSLGGKSVCFLHRTNFRLLGQCQCETSGCGCNSNPASSTSTTTVGMTVTTEPSKTTTQTTTSSLNLVSGEHCKSGKVAENPSCPTTKGRYCQISPGHTLCQYCGSIDFEKCTEVCGRGLSHDEKKEILELHNQLRRTVAKGLESRGLGKSHPAATDMFKLEWSDELEQIAQAWTDQCEGGHDTLRNDIEGNRVGQNFAASWSNSKSNKKNLKKKIMAWYDEVKDWPPANLKSFSTTSPVQVSGLTGHFTQMIWAKTMFIGCGFIANYDKRPGFHRFPFRQVLICNYSPSGNTLRQRVYQEVDSGRSVASDCPRGDDDGLCLH